MSKAFERQHGRAPADRRDIRSGMVLDLYFQHYAAANRIAQELLWEATNLSVDRELPELIAKAKAFSSATPAELDIPEEFEGPRYVTALDIHCMPGGYATEVTKDDVSTGILYDRGVYLYAMGYMGPLNDDMGRSVCNYTKRNLKGFSPRRILDMGCTVGHATLPYKELFPNAEVWGIDVAAPQVRYAHARAAGLGLEVNFAQMNAEETRFPGGHFDLMDPFTQFILDNETWYNNEPVWGAMRDMDQFDLAERAGFVRADVKFDTAPMAVMEFAAQAAGGYSEEAASAVAEREFTAGEYAPGGGWEVLIAQKPAAQALAA